MFARAHEPKQLVVIDGAGHVFNDDAAPQMVAAVMEWVKREMA